MKPHLQLPHPYETGDELTNTRVIPCQRCQMLEQLRCNLRAAEAELAVLREFAKSLREDNELMQLVIDSEPKRKGTER